MTKSAKNRNTGHNSYNKDDMAPRTIDHIEPGSYSKNRHLKLEETDTNIKQVEMQTGHIQTSQHKQEEERITQPPTHTKHCDMCYTKCEPNIYSINYDDSR